MDDVITLLTSTMTQGTDGVWKPTQSKKDIFCQIDSITRQEFFDAGRNGLNPEFRATIFAGDYSDEVACKWHGKRYAVYRTYHVPGTDYLELYFQREGGTNGPKSNA